MSKQIHNAIVTRNIDDDLGAKLRGGVYFDCPTLFEGEYPIPAMPNFQFAGSANGAGMFWVPQVGDEIEVEIEVDDGNSWDTTEVELSDPRYRAMVYSDAADLPEIFKINYGQRMGWVSNKNHYLLFDDSSKQMMVALMSGGGHGVVLDDVNATVEVKHKEGGKVKISKDKVELIDNSGAQSVILEAGKITSKTTGDFIVESQKVKLGIGASFHATLSENVIGLHDTHTHVTTAPGAPTTPPQVPMSSKAGTPLDPTALRIYLKGNT